MPDHRSPGSKTVALPRRNPPAATTCRFFLQGFCRAGDSCVFIHEKADDAAAPHPRPPTDAKLPCKFFLKGFCSRGAQCAFTHPQAATAAREEEVVAAVVPPASDSRSKVPCSFFAKGHCRNGESCPFLHVHAEGPAAAGIPGEDTLVPEQEEQCTRELLGAWVSFGPGASVEKVSLSSDFSIARIMNLPAGSTSTSVSQLLCRLVGIQVPISCVRLRTPGSDNPMTADVRVEDPDFAKSLCDKLEAGAFSGIHGVSSLKVIALAVPTSSGAGGFSHRVNCKKVTCSWHKPMGVWSLVFNSEHNARQVCGKFSSGAYKVLGTKVSCGLRQAETWISRWSGRHPAFSGLSNKWTLTLRVPLKASTKDVLRMIPAGMRPIRVESEGTTYSLGEAVHARQFAMIERLLLKFGPLEMPLTGNMEAPGKRVKAMARFENETDAMEAALALNNTRLPFNESDKLNVNLVYSATYRVATKIFQAVQGDIEAAKSARREQQCVHFKSFPPANGYVTLRLEGETRTDLSEAEEIVDGILRGQTVTDHEDGGNKAFWHPSFGNRAAAGRALLGRIEQEFGVAFHSVPAKAEIKVYGPPGKVDEAREALLRAFSGNPSTSHFISLDEKSFQWAIRGGFQTLRDSLGPENVMLSVLPTLKRIDIIGPRSSYDLAVDIMSGKKKPQRLQQQQQEEKSETSDDCCSVCWTDAEKPLKTQCGHVYCLDCFENFCQSAESEADGFSIRCLGDGGSCGTVLGLPELQEHLSSYTFEELLGSSLKAYVNKRPQEFRYCPTADCGRVYRVTPPDRPGVFKCPGCSETTCSSCHAYHLGKSCAEHKYITTSGGEEEFEKAKAKLGIKDCPKCDTSIQKSDGCNHMECRTCGAHICWVCLATFVTSDPCYSHMNRTHGSAYFGDPLYDISH